MKIDGVSYALGQHRGTSIASITEDTETTLIGILKGNGSKVGVQPVDVTPSSGSPNPITSGGVYTALSGKAATSHASASSTYGLGSDTAYGHVMLSDSTSSSSGESDGVAATPAAVKAVMDAIPSVPSVPTAYTSNPEMDGTASPGSSTSWSRGDHVHPSDSSKADASALTSHTGDTTVHITSAERTSWNGKYEKPSSGIPATDLASGVIPTVPSASTTTPSMDGTASYGSGTTWARADHVHPTDTSRASASDLANHTGVTGNASSAGHLKLSDSTTSTSDTSGGIAATPAAVKAVKDAIPSVPSAYTSDPAMDGTASPGSSTGWAKGDHVHPTDTSRAPLASPEFTGTPKAPTAASGTNTTQIATTAFVNFAVAGIEADLAPINITGTTNDTGAMIASGTYFRISGTLVKAKTDIANGAPLTENTNYETVTSGGLNDVVDALTPPSGTILPRRIGSIPSNKTTATLTFPTSSNCVVWFLTGNANKMAELLVGSNSSNNMFVTEVAKGSAISFTTNNDGTMTVNLSSSGNTVVVAAMQLSITGYPTLSS